MCDKTFFDILIFLLFFAFWGKLSVLESSLARQKLKNEDNFSFIKNSGANNQFLKVFIARLNLRSVLVRGASKSSSKTYAVAKKNTPWT